MSFHIYLELCYLTIHELVKRLLFVGRINHMNIVAETAATKVKKPLFIN